MNTYKINIDESDKLKLLLFQKCIEIKCTLSIESKACLDVNDFKNGSYEEMIPITRQEYETMAAPLLYRAREVVKEAIDATNLTSQDIDKVLLVGGGCRMQMIQQMLRKMFTNAEHLCNENPEEVVAIGAAYYALYIRGMSTQVKNVKKKAFLHFGVDPESGDTAVYNSETLKIMKCTTTPSNTPEFLKELCKKMNLDDTCIYGCACICLNSSYNNETRELFIKTWEKYGFLNVQILDEYSTRCLALLQKTQDIFKINDGKIIWTVYEEYPSFSFDVWKFENKRVKLIQINDNKGSTKPDIVVSSSSDEGFDKWKKFMCPDAISCKVDNISHADAALIQARAIAGDSNSFLVETVLDREVYFGISPSQYESLKLSVLPLYKILKIYDFNEFYASFLTC